MVIAVTEVLAYCALVGLAEPTMWLPDADSCGEADVDRHVECVIMVQFIDWHGLCEPTIRLEALNGRCSVCMQRGISPEETQQDNAQVLPCSSAVVLLGNLLRLAPCHGL